MWHGIIDFERGLYQKSNAANKETKYFFQLQDDFINDFWPHNVSAWYIWQQNQLYSASQQELHESKKTSYATLHYIDMLILIWFVWINKYD